MIETSTFNPALPRNAYLQSKQPHSRRSGKTDSGKSATPWKDRAFALVCALKIRRETFRAADQPLLQNGRH
jgi:hypothetical protein